MKAIKNIKRKIVPRRIIAVASIVLFTLGINITPVSAQQMVCLNDTVTVFVDDYRGSAIWQKSSDGIDWTNFASNEGDTIFLIADEAFQIRLEVSEGDCLPVYSDVLSVELHDPPVVEFVSRDSACVNERDFLLTGGIPEGGMYSGPGVANNRFNPEAAGIGIHELTYSFGDPITGCVATSISTLEAFPVSSSSDAGTDINLIMADSVQLMANEPDNGIGTWSVISGEGGSFTDINDPTSWFFKDSAQLDYELRWTIEGPCGSDFDNIKLNFMLLSSNPCPGTPILVDADGNTYKTVQIGNQCWMAENLRTGKYVPSTATESNHSNLSDNGIIEKYCFENDTANCTLYGGLYDWHETMAYSTEEGTQGVCPDGWHVPSNQDWADLDAQFSYGDAGEHLKETGESGFGGQFAGTRHQRGGFYSFGSSGFFWSSSTYEYRDVNEGFLRKIAACNGWLEKDHFNKILGLSVRCVKDN